MKALALFALLYVTNERVGSVQAIDTTTDRVVRTARIGNRPRGMALSPDGKRLYVAVSWWRDGKRPRSGREAIAVFDAVSLKFIRTYPSGTDPECVAVSPDGRRLYLSNEDAGTASIVDVRSGAQQATLVVGTEPEGVTASPDGKWVYVTAETSNVLSVIDAKQEKTVANILVDPRPRPVIFTRDATRAWPPPRSAARSCSSTSNGNVLRRIKLGATDKPVGLALSPDEKTLYVATGRGNEWPSSTRSPRLVATIPTGQRVWGIAISPTAARSTPRTAFPTPSRSSTRNRGA